MVDTEEEVKIQNNKNLSLEQKVNLIEQKAIQRFQKEYLPGISGMNYLCSMDLPPKDKEKEYKITMTARNVTVIQYVTIYYDNEYKRYHTKSRAEKDGVELFNSYN